MELTPVKTEAEKASGGQSRWLSYPLLLASVAVAVIALPPIASFVSAAPLVAGVLGIGGAAAVVAQKSWRDTAVGFFSKLGGMYKTALGHVVEDYRGARDWAKDRAAEAKDRAAEAKAVAAPEPVEDAAPGGLGAKASAADFRAASEAATKVKAPKPAPAPKVMSLG